MTVLVCSPLVHHRARRTVLLSVASLDVLRSCSNSSEATRLFPASPAASVLPVRNATRRPIVITMPLSASQGEHQPAPPSDLARVMGASQLSVVVTTAAALAVGGKCSFWNATLSGWDTRGCRRVAVLDRSVCSWVRQAPASVSPDGRPYGYTVDDCSGPNVWNECGSSVTCECTHLSDFSLVLEPPAELATEVGGAVESTINGPSRYLPLALEIRGVLLSPHGQRGSLLFIQSALGPIPGPSSARYACQSLL